MKTSIIIIVAALFLIWAMNIQASKHYWENVGPQWDIMLNPCDYNICE